MALVAVVAVVLGLVAGLLLGRMVMGARVEGARQAAEARLDEAQAGHMTMTRERDQAYAKRDEVLAAANALEMELRLAHRDLAQMRERMTDWEETKAKFMEATQAGVLATAQTLSSKLIEDHKRESLAAKEAAEKQLQTTSEQLRQEVKQLQGGVEALKGHVAEKSQLVDTVWTALTNPGGAGYFAEVGLANTLRTFGLVEGRDFVLQETVYGEEGTKRLRPDAIVFLPGDSVLVIDSKASKHLLDIARAATPEARDEAQGQFARRMNQHLKDLAGRDYDNAVRAGWNKAGRPAAPARVLNVMYLPHESAIERLGELDADFALSAAKAGIIPAGPAGLACIIGFASVEIRMMRQIENQEHIVQGAEKLLESLAIAIGHVASVGRGIRQAADGFAKLTTTVNSRLLPRARQLQQMGLRPPKPVPGNLNQYQVLELGADATIEGEVAPAETMPSDVATRQPLLDRITSE
ncbi:MAG TPA: DNA recombination protein RmuC [Stellaceae bacterium]|nr:DNA recombination protein RmuC [Stellaceae bacterium]